MPTDASSDVTALLLLLLLVVIALTAPWFGADTRASREWSEEHPLPRSGDRP